MSPSLCACCNYLIQFNLTCLIVSKWSVNPYLTMFNHHQLSFCACCVNNSNFKKTITVFVACSALVRLLPSFFSPPVSGSPFRLHLRQQVSPLNATQNASRSPSPPRCSSANNSLTTCWLSTGRRRAAGNLLRSNLSRICHCIQLALPCTTP